MHYVQGAYHLTSGITNGVWSASIPWQSLRFGPFYNVIYFKNFYFSPFNDLAQSLSSHKAFSWTCQGIYYGTPLALKGMAVIQYVHGKSPDTIERYESYYKTVFISLWLFSAAWGIRKAALENNVLRMAQTSGLFIGGSLEALAKTNRVSEQKVRSLLNKLWWVGILLSFVEGKGISGGLSLLNERLLSTLAYYSLCLLTELPILMTIGLGLITSIKNHTITVHPILNYLGTTILTTIQHNRESTKNRCFQEMKKNQAFNQLSIDRQKQALTLIEDCFNEEVIDAALQLCNKKTFQDQCQTLLLTIFSWDRSRIPDLLASFLTIDEVQQVKTAFEQQALKAPDLFPYLQLPDAIKEGKSLYDLFSQQNKNLVAESDPTMMEYFIALIYHKYAFGEKKTSPIPLFLTSSSRTAIAQMRTANIGRNQATVEWMNQHFLDSYDHYGHASIPEEHQALVNLFRQEISAEIRDGIIIKKVWPQLISATSI
jgi:hypothetical protein